MGGARLVWLERVRSPFVLALVTILGMSALGSVVGADARWLAALGAFISTHHEIPTGVPFAAASTLHWHNAVVLAELLFHTLEVTLGDRGLMLAQLVAVGCAASVLMRDARAEGASGEGAGTAMLLCAVGSISSLVIARVQLFSLVLFALLAALLRSEARRPSRRIWLVLPLLAVWSNLHGAVLIGLGILLVYLVLERGRRNPATAAGVAGGALIAICCTPAGLGTIGYYQGLLGNQAAARGQGLWAPLSLSAPLDVLMAIVMIVFAIEMFRNRPRLWEIATAVVLTIATVKAARSGVWLVFFCAVPAARGFTRVRWWNWVMPPVAVLSVVGLLVGVGRGPLLDGAPGTTIARASALAGGSPILADDVIVEQLALNGDRVWVGNPIDAFDKRTQIAYLNWLAGDQRGLQAIQPSVRVIVTSSHSAASRLMARDADFRRIQSTRQANIYVRRVRPQR